jgi:hypothetical protein
LGSDSETGGQFNEVGIRPVVEHDEAGIDGVGFSTHSHRDGMGMAADIAVGLEDRNIVVRAEKICGEQTRDAATDNCDSHGSRSSASKMYERRYSSIRLHDLRTLPKR